VAKFSTFKLSS